MLSIFLAYLLELIFGKPRWLPQPVNGLNLLIAKTENYFRRRYRNTKTTNVFLVLIILAFVFLAAKLIAWGFIEVILIYLALSIKEARHKLDTLSVFIREPDNEQLTRSKIEFIAQDTAKDVVGVLFYAFFGGAVLAWVYKAVNLLKNSGWFASRLAAIFNYIPFQICIFLIPFVSYLRKMDPKASFKTAWTDGRTNTEIPEAAFAGALGIQLGGLVYYHGLPIHKPYVGHPYNELNQTHIQKALELMYVSSVVVIAAMIVINYFWNVL